MATIDAATGAVTQDEPGNLTDTAGQRVMPNQSAETTGLEGTDGTPYATIGDKTFKDHAELSAFLKEQGEGTATTEEPAADPEATPEGAPKEGVRTVEEIKASLAAAGGIYADPKYETAAIEFEQTGKLSPETLTKTAAAFGVPEEMVKQFMFNEAAKRSLAAEVAALKGNASVEAGMAPLHAEAGGKPAYDAFLKWGSEGGLTEEQKVSYNKALDTDPAVAKTMLTGFLADMKRSGAGGSPRDITDAAGSGGGSSSPSVQPFKDNAEMQAAQNDPLYRKGDPAFHRTFNARVQGMK